MSQKSDLIAARAVDSDSERVILWKCILCWCSLCHLSFLSFTNWSSTVTTTTWENNPQWNISQCALFLWNRFVTLYARLVDFLSSVLLFSKLLTQSPHICHTDHSLAKTPKHLAQNVNIQFARIWVNISERKKFWPKYLEIGPILNKDAPLAQTQLASCRKNVKFPMMK